MPARLLTSAGIRAEPLAIAGFVMGFAAVPFIAHSAFLVGLVLILASRSVGLLGVVVAQHVPRTAKEDYLERILELVWSASLPFGFALAEPECALAAMFLMLGLVARAAALTVEARPAPGIEVTEFGADLVGQSELTIVYATLCIFPHWFSIATYALGIACFVMTGFRVAKFRSQRT